MTDETKPRQRHRAQIEEIFLEHTDARGGFTIAELSSLSGLTTGQVNAVLNYGKDRLVGTELSRVKNRQTYRYYLDGDEPEPPQNDLELYEGHRRTRRMQADQDPLPVRLVEKRREVLAEVAERISKDHHQVGPMHMQVIALVWSSILGLDPDDITPDQTRRMLDTAEQIERLDLA